MKVMLTVGRYFKQKFGFRVRKIPISLSGFTCPNIDGSVAKGGCIYCKNESFSPSLMMKKKQKDSKMETNIESKFQDSKEKLGNIESSDHKNQDSITQASLDSKENTEYRFHKTNEFNNLESKKVTESTNSQNLDSKENTESMQNMQQKFATYHHPHPPTHLEEKQRISAAYSSSSNKTQNLDSKNHKDSKEKLENIESSDKLNLDSKENTESRFHKNNEFNNLESKKVTESNNSQNLDSIKPKKITMNFKLTHNPLLERQLHELETQFEYHSKYHKNKFGISKYLVYFQSFTNTYAPFDTLKSLYTRALSLPDVVGMSIGTRVDCVDSRLLDFLGEFVKQGKEIWLEYGIQSIYEETLKLTNRGHTMQGVEKLFKDTRARGIKVCAHLIYGLPKESVEMMINSLKTILNYGVDSLKIHPLYVVEGTALARMYKRGEYEPISLETYGEAIAHSLKLIPPNVVVQRVSAGAHDDTLIAPKWCFDKNIQMRYLRERLKKEGIEY